MIPDRRLALEKTHRVRDAELRQNAKTQMDVIGHRMSLNQFHSMLATQLPQHLPNVAAQRPVQAPLAILGNEYDVIFAVPSHMRLALPLSHDDLLPFEFGDSLEGGHLLDLAARLNGRASASLTARGGGLRH